MKKKETLIDLLDAESNKTTALWSMQREIEYANYGEAMHYQFMYLYWCDEWARLYKKFTAEYWNLKYAAGV